MINSFWWGGGTNNRGIKWLAWDRMAYPKEFGGLGFRNLHLFNMAMVAKQGWKFMTNPNTLVAKVYKARWRIGDGTKIKVMNEPWLKKEDGMWMPSPQEQGCLPTRTRLKERCVQVPLLCPICENEEESDWHFLFECDSSKRAWNAAGVESIIIKADAVYHYKRMHLGFLSE
ncbi:RNA-directed DNA polymerase (Reverse transcriptase) [Trifolium medium]|uniref:RNA-directed DNA polymerase (Reverse transcriptase) n=1 Tax=Trifolium medium TaxID=97028 RepID=A0A392P590_9FABA|nr:RNA-directed DNA polymerase (Reverse transcriptase) [Trifolium medium]